MRPLRARRPPAPRAPCGLAAGLVLLLGLLPAPHAAAQIPPELVGRPIEHVDLAGEGTEGLDAAELGIEFGSLLTRQLLRRLTTQLVASERWADVRIDAAPDPRGARIRVTLLRRIVLSRIDVLGNAALSTAGVLSALRLAPGDEIASGRTAPLREALRAAYAEIGYENIEVDIQLRDTAVVEQRVLRIAIDERAPTRIVGFEFVPDAPPDLGEATRAIGLDTGSVLDRRRVEPGGRALETALRAAGWLEAEIGELVVSPVAGGVRISVPCRVGRHHRVVVDGAAPLAPTEVEAALGLSEERLRPATLAAMEERVADLYRRHGFPDAAVEVRRTTDPERPGDETRAVLAVLVQRGERLRVVGVSFPGASFFASSTLRDQIRSYLEEGLPRATLFEPVDSAVVDLLGVSGRPAGAARSVLPVHEDLPDTVWYEPLYREAAEHIGALYESEGFLAAEVDTPTLRRFDDGTAIVEVGIREGPRTLVFDVAVEGNAAISSAELLALSRLERGAPFSQLAVEEARARIVELYRERGFLFARVFAAPHLSGDASRASVTFEVVERFAVRIGALRIEGCVRTDPGLVRGVLDLAVGEVFRPSLARENEEALLALGVFDSVRIAPDAPDLAEQVKTIVVSVRERTPQELGLSAGISTGEGLRGAFDYGYRNLFGWGLSLSLRAQLAFQFLFQDDELRQAIELLTVVDRLERRITAGFSVPHLPGTRNLRLSLDLVHLRDNFRDFGLDKNGVVLALGWTPVRRLAFSLSGEIEHNDVGLFQREAYEQLLLRADPRTQRLLRVPEGESAIGSARLSAVLDLRDNAFNPTGGLYTSITAEWARTVGGGIDGACATDPHQGVAPDSVLPRVCLDTSGDPARFFSHFLKLSLAVSGYVPVAEGWVLALQARAGRVVHLEPGSRTYPNRVFYLGGVDSMRGYLQDQVIPQDQLDAILREGESVTAAVVRNGDFFSLLRAELRFPIVGNLGGAVFLDAGNVWANADAMRPEDYVRLRWNVGLGLRYATPVGPLAVDYGFNLSRQTSDEPFGAFHFSIGLF